MIKLVSSNFARWFIGVLGRESPILRKFAPQKPIGESATTENCCLGCISLPRRERHATDATFVEYRAVCGRISACVDTRPSPKFKCLSVKRDNYVL